MPVVIMEECELCGAPTKSVYVVNVEDVELRVCAKCAEGKKVIKSQSYGADVARRSSRPKREEDQPLVENYGKIIHDARDRMQLPLKVLAEMLNEKETLLARIEQQSTLPTIALTKKLEKALSIRLIDSNSDTDTSASSGARKGGATLGEFVSKK
jgi:putative transcription factor